MLFIFLNSNRCFALILKKQHLSIKYHTYVLPLVCFTITVLIGEYLYLIKLIMKKINLLFAALLIAAFTNSYAQFTNGGTNKTVLVNSGDSVGIGVSPSYKLDLNGDFNIASGSVFRYGGTPFLSQTTSNLFTGQNAGLSISTGINNIYYGHSAGYSTTSGSNNTFIGFNAGYNTTIASGSTFLGAYAGYSANTPSLSRNTFLGYKAGYSNTSGTNNLIVGYEAGYALTTGARNVIIGNNTGKLDSLSTENTFVGNATGNQSTGNYNLFLGYGAGGFTAGNKNTFLGYYNGINATGSKNTYLGSEVAYYAASSDSNVCIGAGATPHDSSDNNILIGNSSSVPSGSVNRAVISHRGTVLCDSCMLLGDTTTSGSYHVGIGTNNPSHQLQLSTDDAAKLGTATWTVISDMRLKKNIEPYTDGLSTLMNIQPVWFNYNGMAGTNDSKQFVGVLAQDMQKIAPYTVGKHTFIGEDKSKQDYLSFDANSLFYISINAIKEQQKQIEDKETKIKELEAKLADNSKKLEETNKKLDDILQLLSSKNIVVEKENLTQTPAIDTKPTLQQNVPNPFSSSTVIGYTIPSPVKSAQIEIYDITTNRLIKSYDVTGTTGAGQVEFMANGTISSSLIYKLVIDGYTIDQKKMIQQ